ncbi:hypothetical protein [Azospirillum palustre]|uniref:hypothetical protein n=1 Tax=Azospirillum palustre TaxID=2044885 RepID=UPI001177D565|nr:hypothetical protein [Azospirillum palustre]
MLKIQQGKRNVRRQTIQNSGSGRRRDNFTEKTIAALAKRSAFQCAICSAVTVGASAEAPNAVVNVGVAAHITAASQKGPRYDILMTPKQRSSIENAIWLCQTHAKLIDDDRSEWTTTKLHCIKRNHEESVRNSIGVPRNSASIQPVTSSIAQEYAFVIIRTLTPVYKSILTPMLQDQNIGDDSEVGILMIGSPMSGPLKAERQIPWTVFVKPAWLRWVLQGHAAGFGLPSEVPPDQIYGKIPAWPDEFFEFLSAIVKTGTEFEWQRTSSGYLALAQRPSRA